MASSGHDWLTSQEENLSDREGDVVEELVEHEEALRRIAELEVPLSEDAQRALEFLSAQEENEEED